MPRNRGRKSYYQVGGNIGRGAGTIAGQALIPVPGLGGAIGGFVGQGLGQGFESLLSSLFSSRDPNNFEPTQGQDVGTVRMQEGGPVDDPAEIARRVIASANAERERLRKLFNSGNLDKEEFGRLLNTVNRSVEFAKSRVQEPGQGNITRRQIAQPQTREISEPVPSDRGRGPLEHFQGSLDESREMEENRRLGMPKFKDGGKSGIHIKKKNRGKFTAFAKRKGMGVQEAARHVLANKDNYSSTIVKRANFARNAAKFNKKQFGGQVPLTNSAVEFRGPIHEDGGIPLPGINAEVEGGETMDQVGGTGFIFSNTLKVPGTDESFADRHKKLAEAGASRTAINKLASLQESVKISSGRKPRSKKQFGGIIDDDKDSFEERFGPNAGFVEDLGKRILSYKGRGAADNTGFYSGSSRTGEPTSLGEITVLSNLRRLQPAGVTNQSISLQTPALSVPGDFNPSISGGGGGGRGLSLGDTARRVAPFAGDIINTARGLFGRRSAPPAVKVDRSHIDRFPTTVNVRPEIDAATRAYRSVVGDPGVSGQQQLSAHASHLQNLSRIHGERTRAETGLATQKAQLAGRASELDAQFEGQRRIENQAIRNARESLISEGLSGFARTLQGMRAEDLAQESNLIGLASIMTQLPEAQREEYINTVLKNLPSGSRDGFKKMVGR